jgi:hypothetical protein
MKDDLIRMEYIPNNFYNFHPENYNIDFKAWF